MADQPKPTPSVVTPPVHAPIDAKPTGTPSTPAQSTGPDTPKAPMKT